MVRAIVVTAFAASAFAAGCLSLAGLDGDYTVGEAPGSGGSTTSAGAAAPSSASAGGSSAGGSAAGGSSTGAGGVGSGGAGGMAALGPFGTPTLIVELNSTASEDDPSLTGDMLEIYFDSSRPGGSGGGDIWFAKRASVSDPWEPPTNVSAINSNQGETTPGVSPDGLTLFFTSDRNGNADIFVSTRTSRTAPWSNPVTVSPLNSSDGDYGVDVAPDLLSLLMNSLRPGAGNHDLYVSTRASVASAWGAPVLVAELDTQDVEADASLNPSRTVVYFASDRPGGMGDWDIYTASRSNSGATFDAPTPVTELNSSATDGDPWLSPDMKTLIFSSNRSGNSELYIATR